MKPDKIIAITGSAGKTTTKEFLAAILETRWRIIKTRENYNYYTHTAKYAKLLTSEHEAAVLEYGLLYAGDITKHCNELQPNIGIITNVGTAHIGHFGSLAGLAKGKSELIGGMDPAGTLFLNADDENSKLLQTQFFKGKILTVGVNQPSTYKADNIQYTNDGMKFDVNLNGKTNTFTVPIYGEHNIYNALFAISVSHFLGFTSKEIELGLQSFQKQKHRLVVHPLANGIRVIDDTFSSNPHAVKAAIEVLMNLATQRKIVVLGSMLQLGDYSTKGHQEVGLYVAEKKVDYLITYGKLAEDIGKYAVASGFPPDNVFHFSTKKEVEQCLVSIIKPDTTVLVKGSRQMKLNRTVKFLQNIYHK